jgi:hypothetical protein
MFITARKRPNWAPTGPGQGTGPGKGMAQQVQCMSVAGPVGGEPLDEPAEEWV